MMGAVYGIIESGNRYSILYSKPSIMSKCLARLRSGDLVEIDDDNSTACYYKVKTDRNDEGYVMICDVERKGEA